jgi:hypothetical protein
MYITREEILANVEVHWCDRMTELVQQNMINDADALFSEFVLDGKEPFDQEWIFVSYYKSIS